MSAPGSLALDSFVSDLGLDLSASAAKARKKPASRTRASLPQAANEPYPSAGRNNTLTSFAGSMRHRGMSEAAIEAALQAENKTLSEPLEEGEVSSIARSVSRYLPGANAEATIKSLHDKGNADRFIFQHHLDVRYVPERGRWLSWNQTCWEEDDSGQIIERAKITAGTLFKEAAACTTQELMKLFSNHARTTHNAPRLKAMVELAKSDPATVVHERDLDCNDWLLGVTNGVIDLRTCKLRKHRREDLITRIAPVSFEHKGKCPTWLQFLERVCGSDKSLMDYLQRVFGYCLTGRTEEQALFFLYGNGANGKSTFLNVLRELMGPELAKQTPYESFIYKKQGRGATNDLARLQGTRVTLTTEIESGSVLDESLVKQLTGGEAVSARLLYREYQDFVPKFKILIAGNHKPIIRGDDDGIWRRLHLVPFTVTIPKQHQDPTLAEKLRRELPGILNWALDGCRSWQKTRLSPPKVVVDAVQEYRSASDLLGLWLTACCKLGPSESGTASALYNSYIHWCALNSLKPMSGTSFGRKLSERFKKRNINTGVVYDGLMATTYAPS